MYTEILPVFWDVPVSELASIRSIRLI